MANPRARTRRLLELKAEIYWSKLLSGLSFDLLARGRLVGTARFELATP